jgi:hypothetical protein
MRGKVAGLEGISCAPVFTPDGGLLAGGNGLGIRVCDAASGSVVYELDVPPGSDPTALAVSTDGRHLAAAFDSAAKGNVGTFTIKVWDLPRRK